MEGDVMQAFAFYLFAFLTVIFAFLVIAVRNPVTSALSLVASFFGVSGLFILLNAPFLGVVQILIYAGAILVLFLYVTMLLNIRASDSLFKNAVPRRWIAAGIAVFLAALLSTLSSSDVPQERVLSEEFGSLASVGKILLGPYALVFELVSLLLLTAIVGVVVLARRGTEKEGS
ncbi:MAG: NADH-quinone oxidoreductase subunit J [Pseudomonadota bacterium]